MEDPKQTIEVHRGVDLPAGAFNHSAWQTARPVKITQYWSGETASPGRHAEARLLWSERALHLRFVCRQTETLVVSAAPQTSAKTMGLWDRDVCEIFIAPDPHAVERYLEFEAAPTGEWLDVAIHWTPEKRESDWQFHSGVTAAGHVGNGEVSIGMRIPWNHWIHTPQAGEQWRANLFRCVGAGESRGYLAWQPTRTVKPDFHVPRVFGWLMFK
jgi:hypothetical protein